MAVCFLLRAMRMFYSYSCIYRYHIVGEKIRYIIDYASGKYLPTIDIEINKFWPVKIYRA